MDSEGSTWELRREVEIDRSQVPRWYLWIWSFWASRETGFREQECHGQFRRM